MSIPSILAIMTGTEASASVIKAAKAVGGDKAYIEALHIKPRPEDATPLAFEAMSGATVSRLMESLVNSADEAAAISRAAFDEVSKQLNLTVIESGQAGEGGVNTATFKVINGSEEDVVAHTGRVFDLVVVASPAILPEGAVPTVFEAALFRTGRPVLVAPEQVPATIGQRIVFAWNGRREAARVMSEALPVLKTAEEVTVLTCRDAGAENVDPQDVVNYLSRHDVKANARIVELSGSIGETLLKHCESSSADLLMMGGYGHSRFREFVLGGATRTMLYEAKVPLILAH